MLSLIASDMALAAAAYVRRFNCKPQLMRVSKAEPGRMSEQFQTIPHARVSVMGEVQSALRNRPSVRACLWARPQTTQLPTRRYLERAPAHDRRYRTCSFALETSVF